MSDDQSLVEFVEENEEELLSAEKDELIKFIECLNKMTKSKRR